jgi:predicted amidohydrolase YtcJ
VLPGLIDNHCHLIRGGLNYNLELRWDGVRSLADAMAMLKAASGDHTRSAVGARGGRISPSTNSS